MEVHEGLRNNSRDNLTHWLISTQVDGERRQGRVEFWDRGRGWGRISLDGDARRTRIFVHARDVASAKKQLPRGGRVDLRWRSTEGGWGGEDDALVARLARIDPPPVYTVPTTGRLVDLEMAQPVTVDDKLAQRVKEQQKREKLRDGRRRWRSDGLHDDGRVG